MNSGSYSNRLNDIDRTAPATFLPSVEQPQITFDIGNTDNLIGLKPQHKNLKGPPKIKERVKIFKI